MSGVRNLLNIAKSALFASQASVNVASHNIANQSTEGYRKQEANLATRSGVKLLHHVYGEGVNITSIRQRQTIFADRRIYQENTRLGEWSGRTRIMEQIESIFTGIGESDLNAKINDFFNAWEDLTNDPASLEFRTQLVQSTQSLTGKFHDVDSGLQSIRENLNAEISGKVITANELLHKIHELNDKIAALEYTGVNANDLRDQRDRFIRELTGLMDIETHNREHGRVEIIHEGITILNRDNVFELSTRGVSRDGRETTEVYVGDTKVHPTTGEISGLLTVQNEVLAKYQDEMDELAEGIVTRVNSNHELGFDLYGNVGSHFFDPGKVTARNIKISDKIVEDMKKIAAASGTHDWAAGVHTSNGIGDNENAKRIAELRYVRAMKKNSATFNEVYNAFYADVGFDTQEAKRNQQNHQVLIDQLDNYRDSMVGVSLDEELADIQKFQHSYAAASKLVRMADEMMRTLVNMIG